MGCPVPDSDKLRKGFFVALYDGTLGAEASKAMRCLGLRCACQDIEGLFQMLDYDGGGSLDTSEFCEGMVPVLLRRYLKLP